MYQDTITLFNYHDTTEMWYPTVFRNVDLGMSTSTNSTRDGKNNNDSVTLIIHCTKEKVFTASDGILKNYVGAKAYAVCDNPGSVVTFKPERDFIYVGEWPVLSPIKEDEDIGFYHSTNEGYDGVYMISSATFYGLLPHFEIGGR